VAVGSVAVAGWQWGSNEPNMSGNGPVLAKLHRFIIFKKVTVAVGSGCGRVAVAVGSMAVAGWLWRSNEPKMSGNGPVLAKLHRFFIFKKVTVAVGSGCGRVAVAVGSGSGTVGFE
jgi:hypothetical protein